MILTPTTQGLSVAGQGMPFWKGRDLPDLAERRPGSRAPVSGKITGLSLSRRHAAVAVRVWAEPDALHGAHVQLYATPWATSARALLPAGP